MKIGPKLGSKVLHRPRLTLPVTPETPESARPCRKKALLIGINYSTAESALNTNCVELEGPHKDALGMRDLLIDIFGYKEEDVVVMVDMEGVDQRRKPTRRNMIRELRTLVRGAQPGDHFVFLYSGHSDQIPCREHTEDDGFDEVLLPMDSDGVSKNQLIVDNDLRKWLVDPLPPGAQLMAILDACHSGTLLDLDHYDCNKVYFPWVSLGSRDAKTLHIDVVRKLDTFAPVLQQRTAPAALLDSLSTLTSPRSLRSPLSRLSPSSKSASKSVRPSRSLHHRPQKRSEQDQNSDVRHGSALLRRRTTMSVSMAAWAVEKTKGAAADVLKQIVPAAICMSPVSLRKCDGECSVGAVMGVPRVISLAACGDSQITWEHKKWQSMTQDFIQELRDNPRPRLHDLVTKLGHSRYGVSQQLHGAAKKQWKAIKEGKPQSILLDRVNFQDVQIGSQEKLVS
ncbi:hypothetical protein DAEQUDRAFT_277096 [Daedalea quercina L-15889]|uniref:Peptidase C14 caspase domain-containing protein n=1 Tax=Daedalea quercina L-15889 TaxID=1314783 RepID=A0A165Q7Q2_9APHY|nr:hypothetical protein DAEQUDRAFT_277096 [Daedalea quercina L-15889]